MGGFTVQILFGILSPPGDGMVINTLLTQVRKEKNGETNFHLGIEHRAFCPDIIWNS